MVRSHSMPMPRTIALRLASSYPLYALQAVSSCPSAALRCTAQGFVCGASLTLAARGPPRSVTEPNGTVLLNLGPSLPCAAVPLSPPRTNARTHERTNAQPIFAAFGPNATVRHVGLSEHVFSGAFGAIAQCAFISPRAGR